MVRLTPTSLFILSVILLGLVSRLDAKDHGNDNYPTAINTHDADSDFDLQGEYSGSVISPGDPHSVWHEIGLQVIARGGGNFDAALYSAGLPGTLKSPNIKYNLTGKRNGDTLVLRNNLFLVMIDNFAAQIYTARGNPLGQIPKVHRKSPTLGTPPPVGAEVIFNGSNTNNIENGKMASDRTLKQGGLFKKLYSDFTIHLEFKLPYKPYNLEQSRGNSGLYILSRYEVQILDSFGLDPKYNYGGSLYKTKSPDVNMCLPPLSWQTYDIVFRSPQFDSNHIKTVDANISVWHNGIAIHRNVAIPNKTGAGKVEEPFPLPIKLQDHSNPVRFRNIWIIDQSMPINEITVSKIGN